MKPKIIFFGNERLASGVTSRCYALKELISSGYEVVAVVVNEKGATGRKKRPLEIAEVANQHNIEVIVYEGQQQILELISSKQASLGVLSAFGRIISQELISAFPDGILNIHPSLLPQYRGSTPIESAILNGDTTTGVSMMLLTAGMDKGPVYSHSSISVGQQSKQQLYEQLSQIGAKMLVELLPLIIDGIIKPLEQDDSQAIYCQPIKKQDGQIDLNKTASQLKKQVIAYQNWPTSYLEINDKKVIITEVEVINELDIEQNNDSKSIIINTNDKKLYLKTKKGYLSVKKLKPIGKNEMAVGDFINGLRL